MSVYYKVLRQFIFLFLSMLLLSQVVVAEDSHLYPKRIISKAQGDQCVRPAEEMRKVHPDLLKHDRINTLRLGIRTKEDNQSSLDGSLKACINCHAIKKDGEYLRINNEQHFCSSCHIYAGVSFDCFQCHRDIPEK